MRGAAHEPATTDITGTKSVTTGSRLVQNIECRVQDAVAFVLAVLFRVQSGWHNPSAKAGLGEHHDSIDCAWGLSSAFAVV